MPAKVASKPRSVSSRPAPIAQSTEDKQNILSQLWSNYLQATAPKLKLIDCFLVFLCLSGICQFGYCILVQSFPFNAFLASFASTVGQFVLLASLRIQVNSENGSVFPGLSPERAFADFCFGSVILHCFVFNFLG